ncbi:BSP-domain-containing protein [Xylariaceae sp. FL1651]|nr:BSP-domain-containing protein [Xylariaceae sp. FL1651]
MPVPPGTSPVPPSIFLPGMSSATAAPASPPTSTSASSLPTATPLPGHSKEGGEDNNNDNKNNATSLVTNGAPSPSSARDFPQPRLRLHLNDVTDAGSAIFLSAVSPSTLLPSAVSRVQKALYVSPAAPGLHMPPTRSVTLIVRPMDGVAYTTGTDLDPEQHKEIHLSSRYVAAIPAARRRREVEGVVVHELVHCYQHNGRGHAPGGLVEGVADWVRLGAGLAPPHWRRGEETSGKWDAGYQHTAYFLQYLEGRFGEGTVRRLNEALRTSKYEEKPFWTGILGRPVEQLWEDYKKEMANAEKGNGRKEGDKVVSSKNGGEQREELQTDEESSVDDTKT